MSGKEIKLHFLNKPVITNQSKKYANLALVNLLSMAYKVCFSEV